MISLQVCKYIKERKQIIVSTRYFGDGYPKWLYVRSHKTREMIRFVTMPQEHPRYDHDGWDGEEAHYVPEHQIDTVDELIIAHWI